MQQIAFRNKLTNRVGAFVALALFAVLSIAGALLVVAQPAQAAAGIYKTVNFQGKVVNTNGTNVADASYTFKFRIYSGPTGDTGATCAATCIWEESKSITTVNSIFQTNLGDTTALPGSVNFNSDNLYLAVVFNGDTEMTPRIRLTAVPYAFNADMLDGLDSTALVQLSPASQQTGTINVSGNITSAASVNAAGFDANVVGALQIGGSNATSITLAKNTNLSSSFTLSLQGNNSLSLGSTTAAGGIVFKDGTVNNRAVTLSTVGVAASYALNLPAAAPTAGSLCLQTASGSTTNLAFGSCSGGVANVTLQATTPGTPDTGNFNISGIGIAAGYKAAAFDQATSAILNIGTTTASSITINRSGFATTIGGSLNTQSISIGSNQNLTFTSGAGNFDQSASTGTFATSTGTNTLNGDTSLAAGKSFTFVSGVGNFDQSASTGTFKTATGAGTLNGDTTVTSGKNLTVAGGNTAVTGASAGSSTALAVNTGAASNIGLSVKAIASQSADLARLLGANGETLSKFDANGALTTNGTNTSLLALGTPSISSTSTATTGGTLAANTYWYVVTATNAAGETVASVSSSRTTTGATSTVTVNWTPVAGATGYKIYRNTSNAFTAGSLLLTTLTNGTTATYIDTGSATAAGLPPTAPVGTKLVVQAWGGQAGSALEVQNSAGTAKFTVDQTGSVTAGRGFFTGQNSGQTALTVKAASGQTFDLLQLTDASSNVTAAFSSLGSQLTLGNATATGTQQGIFRVTDGTSDGFFGSLKLAGAIAADQNYLLPTTGGTICMQSSASCGFATGTTGSYIQNQNGGAQATSNFWISGVGIATTLQAGTFDTASGTATLAIGTTNASAIALNQNTTLAAGKSLTYTAGAGNFDQSLSTGTFDTGTGAVDLNGNTTVASGKTLTIGGNTTIKSDSTTALQIQNAAGTANLFTFNTTAGSLTLGSGATRTIAVAAPAAGAGNDLAVKGGAAGTGNVNGGNLALSGGAGTGTGVQGLVNLATSAFTASPLQTNSIAAGVVDQYSSIPVTASTIGSTISVPSPVSAVTGRILYVTAAGGSNDFTILLGGTSISIAMKANSTATLIWNGTGWTAAGASSSTDLQSAYNNTLTSAGGAEIVLNGTGGNADGFTIRNNATTPISGGLLEVQSSIGTNLLSVNNSGTELAANGGAETSSSFATDWTAVGAPTISRNTTLANTATGQASAQVSTTAVANTGVRNNLTANPTVSSTYQISFTGKLSSGTFATLDVQYSRDGGTTLAPCTAYSTQTLVTTGWSKVTCTITTDATAATNPDLLIRQTDATARIFWIDNLSVQILTSTSTPPNVQIGGGLYGGAATVLTLDRASSAPVATGNTALLGSMYYDTTSGRIQCYEADGWGACGSSPDNYVNLVPEYPGAVLGGPGNAGVAGIGTLTADFCANQTSVLVYNTSLCTTGQALNYYKWTSPQSTQQIYSIYVTYQLPAAFKQFQSNSTVQLTARTDDVTNGAVTYEMFRSESGVLTACGSETAVTTGATASIWQTAQINGNEADTVANGGCGFTKASANNFAIFKINVKSKSNANVYVGTLSFTTTGQ